MIHKLALAGLTAALLAAGVYSPQAHESGHPANVTVITKNQIFPLRGAASADPCAETFCQEV